MAAEEVFIEVEAVQAVYGDDCVVIDSFPPHLHVHIKPRTADVSSQQFVEATIGIRASSEYPNEPPHIDLIEFKGLDDPRKNHLVTAVRYKARELSSCLMLVSLCEEAVEQLSVMNHPDGNCPLCLYPLVPENEQRETLPFMKLMSCFHCFHSECVIRWWNWLQKERETTDGSSSMATLPSVRTRENQTDIHRLTGKSMGNCPVCRKVFHTNDFEHVLGLAGDHSFELMYDVAEVNDKELLLSDSENIRRQKFEAILKLQQEKSGLIEAKKDILVLPGMYLPQAVSTLVQTSNKEFTGGQQSNSSDSSKTETPGFGKRGGSSSGYRNLGRRKH